MSLFAGRYELIQSLGSGRGGVFRARHAILDGLYCIKHLPPSLAEDDEARRQFGEDARVMVNVDHPSIVRILDLETWEDRPFLVEELVEAQSLERLLADKGPLSEDDALDLCDAIGDVLEHVHSQGFLHASLHPTSVFVERRDPSAVRVTDFCPSLARGRSQRLLRETSPDWAAPEQLRGDEALGPQTDVYRLTAILHAMLTGAPPRSPFALPERVGRRTRALLEALLSPERQRIPTVEALRQELGRLRTATVFSEDTLTTDRTVIVPREEDHADVTASNDLPTEKAWWASRPAAFAGAALGLGVVLLVVWAGMGGFSTPLSWESVAPAPGNLQVREGTRVEFRTSIVSARARSELRQEWRIDGTSSARGDTFAYVPPFEGGPRRVTIRTIATGAQGVLEQTWHLTIVDVNQPPRIAVPSPPEHQLRPIAGDSVVFSVDASDADTDPLSFVWERDGIQVQSGPEARWTMVAPEGATSVRVSVRDDEGATDEHSWRVEPLPKPSPVVASVEPTPADEPPRPDDTQAVSLQRVRPSARRVAVHGGTTVEFEVRPSPSTRAPVVYEWTIDGSLARVGPRGRFSFVAQPTATPVRVGVTARAEGRPMDDEMTWEITADRTVAKGPSVESCPTKDEALLWVSSYQEAWETKNLARLRTLGIIVSGTQESAIRNDLAARRQYRVQLSNLSVTSDGCRVAFDRTDSDASGTRMQRGRQVYTLVRTGGTVRVTPHSR